MIRRYSPLFVVKVVDQITSVRRAAVLPNTDDGKAIVRLMEVVVVVVVVGDGCLGEGRAWPGRAGGRPGGPGAGWARLAESGIQVERKAGGAGTHSYFEI